MKAEVDTSATPAVLNCTDFRDGETFDIRREDVKGARVGFGGAESCFYVTDTDGNDRTLCKSMEAFMKCEEAKQ
jgi:hypothetical protein